MVKDKKQEVHIAGSKCTSGLLVKNKSFRLIRDDQVVYDGEYSVFLTYTFIPYFRNKVCKEFAPLLVGISI